MSSNETYLTIMPLVSLRITALSSPLLGRAKIVPKTTVNIARAVARHSAELASTTEAFCIYAIISFCKMYCHLLSTGKKV